MNNTSGRASRKGRGLGPGYLDAGQTASALVRVRSPHGPEYFTNLSRKIRWRLLFAYVTPLILLSAYFLLQYQKNLREGIDTHLESIAENQRNTVDLYLQERTTNLGSLTLLLAP